MTLLLWLIHEAAYWLWCRWTGHKGTLWRFECMVKPGRPDLWWRTCVLCDRVHPDDVDAACDILEADLAVISEGAKE